MRVWVGTYGGGVWQLDTETMRTEKMLTAQDPSWVLQADAARLYLAEECLDAETGRVALYRRTEAGWVRQCEASTEGKHPCHLALSPDGAWLAAANYTSGSAVVFPLDETGAFGKPTLLPGHHGGPKLPRQSGPHAHFVSFQPEGMICCDLGADEVRCMVWDGTGWIEDAPCLRLPAGTGPRHLVRCGAFAYVICELSGELMAIDWAEGTLLSRQRVADAAEGTAAALRLGEDGRLYGSHRGGDCVSVYDLQADPAHPRRIVRADCGGCGPRDVLPIPGGVVCACQQSNEVTLLRWAGTSLTLAGRAALPAPVGLCPVLA